MLSIRAGSDSVARWSSRRIRASTMLFALLTKLLHAITEPNHLEVGPGIDDDGDGEDEPGERHEKELVVTLAIDLAHELLVPDRPGEDEPVGSHAILSRARSLALLARRFRAISLSLATTGFFVRMR